MTDLIHMSNNNYMRIGDCIRPVDIRNRDMISDKPMGINIDKYFMPSVANVIGTDLSNYKVVKKNQFACNLMHVGRDERLPIAILEQDAPIIVSPAYYVFEIKPDISLMPSFLMLWFKRPEFDRNAWFYTDADVRGGLDRDSFLDMRIPIPSIDEQRRIVAEYQAVEKRIANNEALIAKLEETTTTIYKDMFVDGIDTENLPNGWHEGIFGELADVSSGKTLSDKRDSPDNVYKYPVAGASGIIGFTSEYNQSKPYLTTGRVGTIGVVNKYREKSWTADNVLVIKSDYYDFAYQFLKGFRYEDIIKGGVQNLITQTDIKNAYCLVPNRDCLIEFERKANILSEDIRLHQQENTLLLEFMSTLLGKMVI